MNGDKTEYNTVKKYWCPDGGMECFVSDAEIYCDRKKGIYYRVAIWDIKYFPIDGKELEYRDRMKNHKESTDIKQQFQNNINKGGY